MKKRYLQKLSITLGVSIFATTPVFLGKLAAKTPPPSGYAWVTVVNNNDLMPGSGGRTFNSYNQPSVNAYGVVVMRARSRGGQEGGHGNGGGVPAAAVAVQAMVKEAAAAIKAEEVAMNRGTARPTASTFAIWGCRGGR